MKFHPGWIYVMQFMLFNKDKGEMQKNVDHISLAQILLLRFRTKRKDPVIYPLPLWVLLVIRVDYQADRILKRKEISS